MCCDRPPRATGPVWWGHNHKAAQPLMVSLPPSGVLPLWGCYQAMLPPSAVLRSLWFHRVTKGTSGADRLKPAKHSFAGAGEGHPVPRAWLAKLIPPCRCLRRADADPCFQQ
jgi:hypothetical protein